MRNRNLYSGFIVITIVLSSFAYAGTSSETQKNWNADSLLDLGEFIASQKIAPEADLVTEPQGASLRPVEVVPATAMFYDGRSTNSFKISKIHIPDTSVVGLPSTYLTRSAVMNWELNTAANLSQRFGRQLGTELDATADAKIGIAKEWSDVALISGYKQMGLGSQAYTAVSISGSVLNAATTFLKTTNYVGRSMQIMNPPIRIDTKHDYGWSGQGTVSLRGGGTYSWTSKLVVGDSSIARNTTEWHNIGLVHTRITTEAITPSRWGLEGFMLKNWPVEHYIDPGSTTIEKNIISRSNYTITTRGGVTTYTDHIRGNINYLTNGPIHNYNSNLSFNNSHLSAPKTMGPLKFKPPTYNAPKYNFEKPIIIDTNKKY